MENFDPKLYEIFGRLEKDATQDEIKQAYRTYAKFYHSDTTSEEQKYAEEMMVKLNKAYEILSNPKKREEYDRKLEEYFKAEEKKRNEEERANSRNQNRQEYSHIYTNRKSTNSGVGALVGVALGLLALGLIIDAFSDKK
ncbi:MAG: DnaJ domain-containing protein [Fluviicola sp.]|nr:DnaJ domain-containing protein [Fluviicola sp.]